MINPRILQAVRVNAVGQAIQDVRVVPQELRYLQRTPVVPASEGEILASYEGRAVIADLIADDSAAVVYNNGRFRLETTKVPNIKIGANLTQEQIMQLAALSENARGLEDPDNLFLNSERRIIADLQFGVRQRMNALILACKLDGLTYDRLGIKMTNVTWGMPSGLKVTATTGWDDATNSTPVSDFLGMLKYARRVYGEMYNRATMSQVAFDYLIASDEFKSRVQFILSPQLSANILPFEDTDAMRTLATRMLGIQIELDDSRFWTQAEDGTLSSAPYLPITKVLFDNTADDGNAMAIDFANGVTTESMLLPVAAATAGMGAGMTGGVRGPFSYAEVPLLNPPNISYWSVARGFPRKHRKTASAVLTVGSFSDPIAIAPAAW